MYKKIVVAVVFISIFAFASAAEVFNLHYTLPGFYRLHNNKIDYLKLHKAFSITKYPRHKLVDDPIKTETEIDYENDRVILTPKSNGIILDKPRYLTIESYFQNNFKAVFHKLMREKIEGMFENTERSNEAGLIPEIVIELPKIALPRSVRRFMGNKAGRLSLDGSQRLTFSGNSTKRDEKSGENDRNEDFDVILQQDLNLHLRGTIGEKIHVDVNHQSTSQDDAIPTPTEVNVSYDGDEDEIVQSIEGGNISLALSGSQFISYSVSSEGLFGIKSNLKAGNLEITTIMGKDEAKKNTQKWRGDAQADSVVIQSKNYINREMFFIDHPGDIYALTNDSDLEGYNNNKIQLDPATGKWLITAAGFGLLPSETDEIHLYIDDHNANNNQTTIQGKEIGNDEITYNFNILSEGTEFTIDEDSGIIRIYPENIDFIYSIQKGYTIGVTYTRNDGVVIGNDSNTPVEVKILHRMNQDPTDEEWDFLVRNIYSLGLQNVQNEGFDLKVYTENTDGTANYNAVDSLDLANMNLNEYLSLDTNTDGVVNGEDATVNLESGMVVFPFLKPFLALGDSIIYYEDQAQVGYDEFINYISVKGEIGKENINLGVMNLLPGSVEIKLNGSRLTENVDFIVDYDFGNITMLNDQAKAPDAELDISYQYRPLFDVDNKTILGLRADMRFNENFKLGGTFIYQSETVKEDKPKIYNENRSIILSDIDGELDFELPFITRAIDFIPLIKTDEESSFNLSGEVAMSIPRIYGSKEQHDRKEAYIDDMEAILDSYPLGVQRPSWVFASVPTDKLTGNTISMGKAHLNYYNPQNIHAEEIYDPQTLSEEEERDEVPVLACKIKPSGLGMPGVNNKYWAGLMKYVGNEMDFSEKKYIEFLVKVDTLNANLSYQKPVVMHIDLGVVSEDFYKPGESSAPDKEDGIVTPDGIMDYGEDVGLDRIARNQPGDDPNDDFDNNKIILFGEEEYPNINGTEGNDLLDSEDLNNDGLLGTTEYYFEYSAVINEGLGFDGGEFMESEYNGWRLYRIPLANAENYDIVSNTVGKVPNLKKISYARVWFEVEDSTRVKLVTLDLVGNKWQEHLIRDENDYIVDDEEETMLVGIIDNQKDQHYQPAPYTVIKKDGEDTLEQSLTIDYNNLGEGHYGLATQTFREKINLITYSKIRMWAYSENLSELTRDETIDTLIVRIGPDTLNYYQIKYPLQTVDYLPVMERDNWEAIELDFSDLTQLKNLDENKARMEFEGMVLSLVGKPTLTNTKAISVGLQASELYTGRLYIDDIRVADPYEDIGFAARTTLNTKFADFSDLNVNLTWKSENFQSNANRSKNPTYLRSLDLSLTNKYYLQKFFPAEWGLNIPVTLFRSQSLGIPRFKANSDILRSDLPKDEREREKNTSLTKKISTSFSQSKTPSNKILAYTVKNTSLSGYVQEKKIKSSTSADTTITINLKHTYKLDFQKEDVGLKLFGNYYFYFFPYQIQNDITFDDKQPKRWYWETYVDSVENYWAKQSNTVRTKTITTNSTVKYDLFSDITSSYDLTTTRNLLRRNEIYDINIGSEKKRTQNINLDYKPAYLDKIFMFSVGGDVRYDEDHVRSGLVDTLYYKGNVTRNINSSFTLKNRDMLQGLSQWVNTAFAPDSVAQKQIDEEETEELSNLEQKESEELENQEIKQTEEELAQNELDYGRDGRQPISLNNGNKDDEYEEKSRSGETGRDGEDKEKDDQEETETTSSTKTNLFARIVGYIARLDNIKLTYTNQYKTGFEDRAERPEFLYQLGLPHILDEEGDDKEINMKNNNDKFTASTNFPILNFLTTAWSFSKEYKRTYSNNSSITITTVFPNVSVTLTELERLLKAENFLTSSRISSSYLYSLSQTGDIGFKKPDTEQIRFSMTPLISWIGNWKGNLSTNVSLNYSRTNNIRYFNQYETENRSTTKSATGSVSWTFAAAKGLKILFFKRTKLTNEFSTNVTFSVEDTVTETKDSEGKWEDSVNKLVYNIAPEASYKFNASISGGLTSSYEVQNDRKAKSTISTFRLGIFVEVIF
ncbi:MAG: cell surface protein SprA [Candidatus Cloacimonetes bacterium]|nr:cell surface protein SprA [Candidatus Cloacimonadota bacterium]MCF7814829.1 cell surface protein SprA [Candidatus Cloacimonadota bacterium]MCF7883317.1 cell surface protein SprA [Candidatus Cloacimonadota bacterium]